VINRLNKLAEQLPTRGFDKYYDIIRLEGKCWGTQARAAGLSGNEAKAAP
jgi:hypothetical protein